MLLSRTKTAFSCATRPQARRGVLAIKCVAQPSRTTQPENRASNVTQPMLAAGALLAPYFLEVSSAMATGGDFGLLEGRSVALLHPLVMGVLFLATGYAGYLGWQWRRVRTVGDEIKALKAQVPKVAVAAGDAASSTPPPPSPLTQQIEALEKVMIPEMACQNSPVQ